MGKARRDAVEDVLGDESPLLRTVARQLSATKTGSGGGEPKDEKSGKTATDTRARRLDRENPATASPTKVDRPSAAASPPQEVAKPISRPQSSNRPLSLVEQGKTKRARMSVQEIEEIDALCEILQKQVGAPVNFSQVTRAMWAMLLESEDQLDKVRAPRLRRPATADSLANADFEAKLAGYLLEVLQKSRRP